MNEPTKEELEKKLVDIILEYDDNGAWKGICNCSSMSCPGRHCIYCNWPNGKDTDKHDEDCILVIARQIRKMAGTIG
jgi:hypothetical protein